MHHLIYKLGTLEPGQECMAGSLVTWLEVDHLVAVVAGWELGNLASVVYHLIQYI